jgi:hypothetical protein
MSDHSLASSVDAGTPGSKSSRSSFLFPLSSQYTNSFSIRDLVSRHEKTFHPLGFLELQEQPGHSFDPNMNLVSTLEQLSSHEGTPDNSAGLYQQMTPNLEIHDGQQQVHMGNLNDHMTRSDYRFSPSEPSNVMEEPGYSGGDSRYQDPFPGMGDSLDPTLIPMQSQLTPLVDQSNTDMSNILNNSYGNHHDPFEPAKPTENSAKHYGGHLQHHLQDHPHERLDDPQETFSSSHQGPNHFRPSDHWFGDPIPNYLTREDNRSQNHNQNNVHIHSQNQTHPHPPNPMTENPQNLPHNREDIDFFSIDTSTLDMNYSLSAYLFNSSYSPNVETDSPPQQWNGNDGASSSAVSDALKTTPQTECTEAKNAPGPFAGLSNGVKGKPLKICIPELDEATYAELLDDARRRLSPEGARKFKLPSAQKLHRFLTSYLTCFHHHFPLIHLPTLHEKKTYAPLMMAICSIGALYRLNRKVAKDLWTWGQIMVDQVDFFTLRK